MTRQVPSEPALVIPVCGNARISGHQVWMVVAKRPCSGSGVGAAAVEPVQQVAELFLVLG